jgi:electron transfer flavoprotein alpha subunit
MGVLVFIEQREGKLRSTSLEAVSQARRLADAGAGGEVVAVVAGNGVADLERLGVYGADRVIEARHEALARYQPEGYAQAVVAAAEETSAKVVLLAASALGKDLAPRIAARLDTGLASDCTGLEWSGDALVARRPVYAGKLFQTVRFTKAPAIATLRPLAFAAEEIRPDAGVAAESLEVVFEPNDVRTTVSEIIASEGGKIDLTESEIIVSGGRGLRAPENFTLVEDLAQTLGASVGSSRAVVDAGWRPHSEQVGQTGKTVSPKLYVAIGISGAIQHLAGISSAQCIVAINKDPEAPIFKVSDYGVVGDALEVVPALTEAIKKLNSS